MSHAGRLVLVMLLASSAAWARQNDNLARGDQAFEAADYELAIGIYAEISPAELPLDALSRLGLSYHLSGRGREAEGTFRVVTLRDGSRASAFNNLGAVYYAREEFKSAEDYFREALSRSPDSEIYQRNLRSARYARENRRIVEEVSPLRRETSPPLVASLEGLEGDQILVLPLMREADLEEVEQLEARGDAFLFRKLFEDAVIEYERALEIDRYNAVMINKLGIAYHQNQDLDAARRNYRRVLDLNPYYAPALNNLGSIEQVRGEYLRALDYYRQALEIREPSATVLRNIGACLFSMERYEEGLSVYLQALALDPELFDRPAGFGALVRTVQGSGAMLNYYMAKVFAQVGDLDRTMSYLYRAVEEGFQDAEMLRDPSFGLLAEDERYAQLLVAVASAP